jgi:hypothetical protein
VHEPVKRLHSTLWVLWYQLSGFLRTIENNRGRLRDGDRRAARTAIVDDDGNSPSRVDGEELRFALIPLFQIESMNTMREPAFCESKRRATAVHRRGREEINHVAAGSWNRASKAKAQRR